MHPYEKRDLVWSCGPLEILLVLWALNDSRVPRRVSMVYFRLHGCPSTWPYRIGSQILKQMAAFLFVHQERGLSRGQYGDTCDALLKPALIFCLPRNRAPSC